MSVRLADLNSKAKERSGMIWVSQPGCLRLSGEDRQVFLQRQTTNDLSLLSTDRALATVLTSPTARILDVLYLFDEHDSIGIITLPGRGQVTARHLTSRIFFMDKVSLVNLSQNVVLINGFGPQVIQAFSRLGFSSPPTEDQVSRVNFHGAELVAWGLNPELSLGTALLAPLSMKEAIVSEMISIDIPFFSDQDYQTMRIEMGLPAVDAELVDVYTPFEVGLGGLVSLEKGCYTGQEVLARQVNYEKITQRLMGLRLESQAIPGEKLYSEDGRPAGTLTSFAVSPRLGFLGLAVVKHPYDQPGYSIKIGEPAAGLRSAIVSSLPF